MYSLIESAESNTRASRSVVEQTGEQARQPPMRIALLALIASMALAASACTAAGTGAPATQPGSPEATTASAPAFDWSHALSAPALLAALVQARQSADPWRDVVFSGGIDASLKPTPLERECAALPPCTVIGTIDGVDGPAGVVALGHRDPLSDLPPPTTADDLAGPVALRLPRTGPIEFLGHMNLPSGSGLAWSLGDAAGAMPTLRNGLVLAVDGWLTSVLTSCGPAPDPFDPPLPNPFNCQPPGWIGSDADGGSPEIDVQTFAYLEFATDPQYGGNGSAPLPARHGVYLVRWVEYEAANCHGCRRFLVVGRLDATTPSPNDLANAPPVQSAEELETDLATDRASLAGHVVFVDGQVLPGRAVGACGGTALCTIGTLVGTDETVRATPYTVSLLLPDTDYPTHGLLSFVIRPGGLEYLGGLGLNNGVDRSAIVPVSALRDPQSFSRGPLTVIAHGWLVDAPIPCPSVASPPEPPDTPFGPCPTDWLTPTSEPIPQASASGTAYRPPTDGIRVQQGAYRTFAPDPHDAPGVGDVPEEGTYLVREAQDKPGQPDTQRGWQVVARLAP